MNRDQLCTFINQPGKEDTTLGLYEDIQDFAAVVQGNLERTETLGASHDALPQLAAAREPDGQVRGFMSDSRWDDERFHRIPAFLRDESGATTIEFAVMFIGMVALGYVVVEFLTRGVGL
jgi:hypothetical protein